MHNSRTHNAENFIDCGFLCPQFDGIYSVSHLEMNQIICIIVKDNKNAIQNIDLRRFYTCNES